MVFFYEEEVMPPPLSRGGALKWSFSMKRKDGALPLFSD